MPSQMRTYRGLAGICAAGVILAVLARPAESQVSHDVSFDAAAGIEFDDNITVQQVDVETGQDDFAAAVEAGADWEMDFGDSDTLDLGYSLNYTQQADLTGFDLFTQGTRLGYEHDFDGLKMGATHRFFYTRLGGNSFLKLNRIEPHISSFEIENLFLKATYIYQDKAFSNRLDRDAETHMGQADAFYFADGVDTFFSLAFRFESEDAVAPRFDFDAHILRGGLHTRLPFVGEEDRFKITVEYEGRDYDSITPSIGAVRDDDRLTFDVSWEVPLSGPFFARAEYRYREFDSNLASADYTENNAGLLLGVEF